MIHLYESIVGVNKRPVKIGAHKKIKDLKIDDIVYRYLDGKNDCLPMKVMYIYKDQYGLRNEEKDIEDFFEFILNSGLARTLCAGGKDENFVFYTTKYGNARYYSTDPSEPDWKKLKDL